MKKTPSVFLRNPDNMRELLPVVNPAAQWVIDGEGVATRKYDGTCVMLDEDLNWWARREVKEDRTPPPNWIELDADPETGKRMGWEPIEQSGYQKHLQDALENIYDLGISTPDEMLPGTYELCGPKVGSNFEKLDRHILFSHEFAERLDHHLLIRDKPTTFSSYRVLLDYVDTQLGWEGLVWHHPDGRMAKLKVRDFKEKSNG